MKPEQLHALALRRMKEVFPEEERFGDVYLRKGEEMLCEGDRTYIYFSGPVYFKDEFVNAKMVNRLQNGARILSIGTGEGHLEKLLNQSFAIPQDQISITDYPEIHPRIKSTGFKEYVFDMTQTWPKLDGKFDYIIFPESLNIATMKFRGNVMTSRFFDTVNKVTSLASRGKLEEIPGSDANFFIDLIEQDIPVVKIKHDIINQALEILNPNGEIRISSGIKEYQQIAYMQLRLKRENKNISFPKVKYKNQFYIKKR